MVNHLLETSHPLSSSALRLRASARASVFHLPYTLPSSVSRNPFGCHSYENTGDVGGILPILPILVHPESSRGKLFGHSVASQTKHARGLVVK